MIIYANSVEDAIAEYEKAMSKPEKLEKAVNEYLKKKNEKEEQKK